MSRFACDKRFFLYRGVLFYVALSPVVLPSVVCLDSLSLLLGGRHTLVVLISPVLIDSNYISQRASKTLASKALRGSWRLVA